VKTVKPLKRRCSICEKESETTIVSLGGLVVCWACDDQFGRVPARTAGKIIREGLAALRETEGKESP
jgi:hypothetical protein